MKPTTADDVIRMQNGACAAWREDLVLLQAIIWAPLRAELERIMAEEGLPAAEAKDAD